MHSLPAEYTVTDQYNLSRLAAERYAAVTAAKKGRTRRRRASADHGAPGAVRPRALPDWFWRKRWA